MPLKHPGLDRTGIGILIRPEIGYEMSRGLLPSASCVMPNWVCSNPVGVPWVTRQQPVKRLTLGIVRHQGRNIDPVIPGKAGVAQAGRLR